MGIQQSLSAFPTASLAIPSISCYLPKQENEFIHKVHEELEIFLQRDEHKSSVLMFPPLPSQLRYLIERTIEKYPSLCTFSVGKGWSRRIVVCQSHLRDNSKRLQVEDANDKDESMYEQPLGMFPGMQQSKIKCNPMQRNKQKSNRKTDKAIYLPLALWERDSTARPAGSLSFSEESFSDTTEESLTANPDELSDSSDQVSREQNDILQLCSSELGPWAPSWDQDVSYFMPMDYAPGDACNMPVLPAQEPQLHLGHAGDFIREITENLKDQDVVVMIAQNDYSCYENAWVDPEACSHILEIYNISSMFRTQDLLDAYTDFSAKGLKIHWVDNTHALAVFSTKSAALQALSLKHPLIRARRLSDGTKQSKGKALRLAELCRPLNGRPNAVPKTT
ncbi:hypothetical protein AGOR_G00053360 [Albula goreensis]|uniref:R3H domain-containing protein n=1 Tax=Albula goreensis TaxID=1534307 RepID=A0A8T3DXU3_9TELE|nr:hypothetical protein AGOR_G00053360 [Albula goreensis]